MSDIREEVKKKYAEAITKKIGCGCSSGSSCCGGTGDENQITSGLYSLAEIEDLPEDMIATSFGCGNPNALAEMHAGETVLDLGSGAGLDVLLSAKRVGPSGKAYGLDMTDEMLAVAEKNRKLSGLTNVEFLKGHIEDIPLPDNSIDVIISNCVINLSGDKGKVLKEAFRVLKPGGRFAVSDIVILRELPEAIRQNLLAWAGCIAGAMTEIEYREKLTEAGFQDINVEITQIYDFSEGESHMGLTADDLNKLANSVASAFVRAQKKKPKSLIPGADYNIRQATDNDFKAISKLLISSGLSDFHVNESIDQFIVAEQKEIIGVIGIVRDGKIGLLRSLAVKPECRKAGIAETLVKQALVNLTVKGIYDVYLLTDTAANYMAKFGFKPVDRQAVPEQLLTTSCSSCSTCMKLTPAQTKK